MLAFLEAACLPELGAEEVEFRAADLATANHFELVDGGAVQWEDALDANSAGDLADREAGAHAAAFDADHQPLKDLDAFFLAFLHLHVDLHRVARRELREVFPDKASFEFVDDIHEFSKGPSGPVPSRKQRT